MRFVDRIKLVFAMPSRGSTEVFLVNGLLCVEFQGLEVSRGRKEKRRKDDFSSKPWRSTYVKHVSVGTGRAWGVSKRFV
jgi:hypothetical protein